MSSIQFILINANKALKKSAENASLEAEILLAHVLEVDRTYLRSWPEQIVNPEHLETFNQLIAQRVQGRPIAYILGYREFWSRKFAVNEHVLIPRPETELIIELCLKRLPLNNTLKVIDLGTGSGAIAVTLAVERPKIEIFASDISETALQVAKLNAQKYHINRIQFFHSNWLDAIPETHFDLIISNPPYIAANDPHLEQGDLRFEPKAALIAADNGLHAISEIINSARNFLKPGGCLIIEHGYDQQEHVNQLFIKYGYQQLENYLDLAGNPRVTCGYWPLASEINTLDHPTTYDHAHSPSEIKLPRKLAQKLLALALADPSHEVCGLISAINHTPTYCYPINNIAEQPQTQFLLNSKQQIAALTHMREQQESFYGIYHSHPTGPAIPSQTDLQLTAYPGALHFIISLQTKGVLEMRCFKIMNTLTQEIPMTLID